MSKQRAAAEPWVSAEQARDTHKDLWPELNLAERCGPQLPAVLTGSASYQALLFPGGSMDTVRPLYDTATVSRVYNELVVKVVQTLVARLPRDASCTSWRWVLGRVARQRA